MAIQKTILMVCVLALGETVRAQIARPDAILYGNVLVDGEPAATGAGLAVVARAEGFEQPVAAYRLGDVPAVGNRFLLHVAQSFDSDGRTPSALAPQTGQPIKLYVQPDGGAEVYAGQAVLPPSGGTLEVNLNVSGSDLDMGRQVPRSLVQGCGGGACGAMGLVNLMTLCGGLGLLKWRAPLRRRSRSTR